MNVRDVKYQVDEMIEEGFGSREVPDDFSLFDFLDKDPNAMRTIFIRRFLIIVKNAEGVPYAIDGEYVQDLIDDWNDEAYSCPENDARVLFFMYNGEPVNPYEYDTFESVIRWMQNLTQPREA